MEIRLVEGSDYYVISPLINEWWGGRNMSDMLPKLFFDHFTQTSFIAEKDGKLVGFLIGFLSQTHSNEAYIHFVGVHPEYRKHNIGKHLYNKFFDAVKQNNRSIVRCVTSPVNKVSIAYHTKMGFEIEDGDRIVDGLSINTDYDGPNQDRVLFVKNLIKF
ncbi:GNAT family N-acetyltransferase [Bacillus salipaludis]|uniref:GNAT family N-acetyltransferase n=1 Tax=Bacillus salipaludis TaxID=2547811 RepID=A0A4V3ASW6_9BACI|nr:GNAT family N-acetyltransferase [Bacillus salipaludis]MDQ6597900.1 GNAT family N-acetyltransferase [Bacillus salipaludis]TDK54706.1 GNAT family N-acetyltransferase [Bacillus salipaludis]